MNSSRNVPVILGEIVTSIQAIQQYMQGISRAAFDQNAVLQDAVVRRLEIIGEAAYQLPADWKAAHGSIPWGDIIGMRNRLIHGYCAVDLDIVWDTIHQNIAPLEQLIAQILANEYP